MKISIVFVYHVQLSTSGHKGKKIWRLLLINVFETNCVDFTPYFFPLNNNLIGVLSNFYLNEKCMNILLVLSLRLKSN